MLDQRSNALRPALTAMQIIVAALAMGVISFGVVVVTALVKPDQLQPNAGLLTNLAAVGTLIAIGLSFVLPKVIVNQARRKIAKGLWRSVPQATPAGQALAALGDEGQLVMVYQTALIVAVALVEGGAFFALIATMIDKSSLALALAGLCLFFILLRFPTLGRLENWLEVQRKALKEDRMF